MSDGWMKEKKKTHKKKGYNSKKVADIHLI